MLIFCSCYINFWRNIIYNFEFQVVKKWLSIASTPDIHIAFVISHSLYMYALLLRACELRSQLLAEYTVTNAALFFQTAPIGLLLVSTKRLKLRLKIWQSHQIHTYTLHAHARTHIVASSSWSVSTWERFVRSYITSYEHAPFYKIATLQLWKLIFRLWAKNKRFK